MFWGGAIGAIYLPRINFPPNGPGYYLLLIGTANGAFAYLVLRIFKLNQSIRAVMLSGIRTAIVMGTIAYAFLSNSDIWFAAGAAICGFLLGLLFYTIERGIAKVMPHRLGGDPT